MQPKKGYCARSRKFYGMITVTDKGQIAIPMELRKELGIARGDKLLVVKRQDKKGLNLLKTDTIENMLEKLSKN